MKRKTKVQRGLSSHKNRQLWAKELQNLKKISELSSGKILLR